MAQAGGQAIEDGAALSIVFGGAKTGESVAERLSLFEQVRTNRGCALQTLSSAPHPQPQSVRDAAAAYLPDNRQFQTPAEINEYTFGFDVIQEARKVVA